VTGIAVFSNIHVLISILLFLVCSPIHTDKLAAADSPFVQRSDVQVLVPPGIPVSIDSVAIAGADDNCRLTYQLTNHANEKLKRVRISSYIYNPTTLRHRSSGGDDNVDLAPLSRIDRMQEFTRCIREDERAVLVVWEAESEKSVWKVNYAKLITAVARCLQGKRYSVPKASWWVAVEK
jgi:hypothetical protein